MSEGNGIQSLKRAFSVIEHMAKTSESGITELSKATGLSKATVYRILDTLVDLGYIKRDTTTEKYSLTLKFLRISADKLGNYDITRQMHPVLEKISSMTGETVHLVEKSGESVVYIDKCESTTNSVRMVSKIGMSLDIFTTAVGKAMLAFEDDNEIKRLWKSCEHRKKTLRTIISLDKFIDEMASIRQNGYAVDDEENELDVRCVAVAVPDAYGKYRYAVSISAPKSRTDDEKLKERAELLKKYLCVVEDL